MHNNAKQLKIGLTSRVTQVIEYEEPRDALAHAWSRFIHRIFPDALWQILPTDPNNIVSLVKGWGINALIFTGGNDIQAFPEKDESDFKLLNYALTQNIPVFGVCRGIQVFQSFFGGVLSVAEPQVHVGQYHNVQILNIPAFHNLDFPDSMSVNSFHHYSILQKHLANELVPFAVCEDGSVEGVLIKGHTAGAVMWHPEREAIPQPIDVKLLRWLFVRAHPTPTQFG